MILFGNQFSKLKNINQLFLIKSIKQANNKLLNGKN